MSEAMTDLRWVTNSSLAQDLARALHPQWGLIRRLVRRPLSPGHGFHAFSAQIGQPAGDDDEPTTDPVAWGNGCARDADLALQMAVCEAFERSCGAQFDAKRCTMASEDALEPGTYLDLPTLARFEPHQSFMTPPSSLRRHWLPVERGDGGALLVPATMVWLGSRTPRTEPRVIPSSSSGLACGRSGVEARLKSLCEVIERDAIMRFWFEGTPIQRLRPTAALEALATDWATPKWFSLDSPSGLPVLFCVLTNRAHQTLSVGASCNVDVEAAASKAFAEASFVAMGLYAEGEPHPFAAEEVRSFAQHARHYHDPSTSAAIAPRFETDEVVDLDSMQVRWAVPNDEGTMLRRIIERVGRAFGEVFFADLTGPDVAALGFHVVRALVPTCFPLIARVDPLPTWFARRAGPQQVVPISRQIHPFP